ncbi:hypothetical protein JCM15457_2248 [Liquorilactobacillus sucicola DSM 21376 = JCM 15457]|uniref:SAP domain-containing protein n=1 Tax=Liquorilactobacillus sucicola DSM 21376 = JCM 15457 TaxID=1423806 RepID=A0A023D0I8_9LACO|nr:SAP domain-containing protein [Liquorilactobacillus sucicola]KRN05800.1 hypothetical protein FD15_GL001607 [Liquorilactobacillus sucicola DSM 21376 = JCM 15457]GAJ27275.1 hypothetical protein JCM15457_2248 [Liquorilactobacillus sucicola DSM 21376 = JCM 15457]
MRKIAVPADLAEFKEKYYYKTELVELCRILKLPVSGTKAELNFYLEQYLSGISVSKIRASRPFVTRTRRKILTANQIRLDTKVIGTGFTFNNEARKFFSSYFGVKKFSFKKEMAMIKRQAEKENDTELTVGDLIKRSLKLSRDKEQIAAVSEEQTYQWNNFVRDFFLDSKTTQYNDRLKVAAILWQYVKKSKQEKKYTAILLENCAAEIEGYLK